METEPVAGTKVQSPRGRQLTVILVGNRALEEFPAGVRLGNRSEALYLFGLARYDEDVAVFNDLNQIAMGR